MAFRNAAIMMILMIPLSGCSGYSTACNSLADLSPDRNSEFSATCDLAAGDEVRVNLQDGGRIEGTLVEVSCAGIVVANGSDDSPPLQFSSDQILTIEKNSDVSADSALGLGILGGVAVAVYYAVSNWSMY